MDDTARPLGITIDWNGPGAADTQRQIDLITDAAHQRRYGIIITPAGGAAIDTALQDALSKDIPVVISRDQTSLREQPHLSFLLEDYEAGARLVTERLEQLALHRGTVIILGVDNYSENSVRRLNALESALRHDCPNLQVGRPVVAPFGSGYVKIAAQRSLQKYPDVVAFIALNARAGLGAEAAIEKREVKSYIPVISFDPSLPLLLRLRRGTIDSLISQDMRGMGRRAVENIVSDRENKTYTRTVIFRPLLITRENIDSRSTQDWLQFNPEPHS
jgi:ABC-type sugar transport system substrate-binding protein